MGTVQADVGRQTKVVIIGIVLILAVAAYLVFTYSAAATARQSSINDIRPGRGDTVAESEHYGEVLNKYNKQKAGAAAATGETYVSVFSSRPQQVPPAAESQQAGTAQNITAQAPPQDYQAPPPNTPTRLGATVDPRLGEHAQGLMNNWAAVAHSTARTSDVDFAQAPRQDAVSSTTRTSLIGSQRPARRLVVPAFTLTPAILGTDIDTDENSMVEATIASGEFSGASVYAMGYKRLHNSVDMTFTFMKWQGRSYRINAKSIDKDSMRSVLSGEVNNRYLSRILLPALALGLGRTGQMFEQADTQSVVTPFGTVVQSRSGTPSSRSIVGAMVGGAATEAGQVLRGDAGQVPIKQVLIPRHQTIGIRFIDPVFESDEVGTQATGAEPADSAPTPSSPSPAPPATQ